MSTDGQRTLWRRNIAENFNRLSIGRTNVTDDRQTDDRRTDDDIANMNLSSRSLKSSSVLPTIITWNLNLPYFAKLFFSLNSIALQADYVTVVEDP